MIKKLICILLSVAFLMCTFSACGDDDDISLVMPIGADPICLDPQIAETQTAKTIINNCFEGLVRLDAEYKIIPGVAESWTISPDGLVYTFKLREDTHWQLLKSYADVLEDENYMENFRTEVTAQDFEFALKRAVDKITDSPDADKLYCIQNASLIHAGEADKSILGVKAVDDHTLTITLERANPDFLRTLTLPLCMPCHEEFFNATRAKYGLELKYTFCNGPFYLGRWTADHSVLLYKNEGYKGNSAVKPTAIYLNMNKEESSIITKLKQKDYSCGYISDSAYFELNGNSKLNFATTENSVTGLIFNCSDSTLSNENLRKALSMLTRFDSIEKPSHAINTATGIIPESCRYSDSSYRQTAGAVNVPVYDEQAALVFWNTGLEETGRTAATVKIICTEEYSQQMQKIIQDWQRVLGTTIVAKVEILDEDGIKDAVKKDNFQIALTSITASSSTATDTLKFFTTGNSKNIFNYSDPAYDELVNNIINVHSGAEIIQNMKTAEQTLVDKAVFLPLFTEGDYIAFSNEAVDIAPMPTFEGVCFINGGLK